MIATFLFQGRYTLYVLIHQRQNFVNLLLIRYGSKSVFTVFFARRLIKNNPVITE